MSVAAGAKRIVEHDPRATKRPGQQLGLARGRVSAVAVTSEHPLNVTSHTDKAIAVRRRGPTSSGYPGPKGPGLRRPQARSTPPGDLEHRMIPGVRQLRK